LHDDGFVDLLEVLIFGWIIANLADSSIQSWSMSSNGLSDGLFLLFCCFIFGEVVDIFLSEFLKHGSLVSLFSMY